MCNCNIFIGFIQNCQQQQQKKEDKIEKSAESL